MKKSFLNELAAIRRWQPGAGRAFTLPELLVVLGTVAMLSVVLLSASFTTPERVLRAQCVANLRQIANGWNMYQQDFNQVMPCHWPGFASPGGSSNPWRTHEAGRAVPGTTGWQADANEPNGHDGPWNLGLLFDTGLLPNPRVFYCPASARFDLAFSYNYCTAVSNIWPSTSLSSIDAVIRTGYNYLPQGRKQENIGSGRVAPKLSSGICPGNSCTPLQQNDIDPNKSILTDLARNLDAIHHRSSGSIAGLNAVFPDGRVTFQNARNNPQAFDPNLWKFWSDPDYISNNPVNFRYVMSLWKP